jgi:4-amino-4-deoxy-L-arabinose transferase-like glycosyltransferase
MLLVTRQVRLMDRGPVTQESAEPAISDTPLPRPTAASSHRAERAARPRIPGSWPLAIILTVQALLSVRLVRADTAFVDEATYLWAGHLEWSNLLHGTSLPPFSAYFSGAPVIYPPLGALADSVGGLTGARILSLVFMLGATVALWSVTGRLHGRRAAFFACALFAVLGPTLHLGAFATYDAMSLFLMTLAAWLVVRAGDRQDATVWMLAAAATLAVANATSYPSALFDPVVIVLALVVAMPRPGGKLAAARALALFAILALLLTLGLLIGGSSYLHGVQATTLARAAGTDSAASVLTDAWTWTGVVVVAAICGVVMSWIGRPRAPQTWLLTLVAAAALLVPAEQAGLRTTASLNKHVDLGAWFAAIAAGYAVDRFAAAAPAGNRRAVTVAACVIALSFPVSLGAGQSWVFATDWANSSAFIAVLRPLADDSTGALLVEDPTIAEYYLPAGTQWTRWSSTRNILLPGGVATGGPSTSAGIVGAGNAGLFGEYIKGNYFSLVALNFSDTTALDFKTNADLERNHHYKVVEIVPYGAGPAGPAPGTYKIWQFEPRS